MDFSNITNNLPLFALIIGLLLLQYFFWKPRPDAARREIVQSLLTEVKLNLALVGVFNIKQKPRMFEVTAWQRNKGKLDFLHESLQVNISDACNLIEDFNQKIEAAKKAKESNYMVDIKVNKLKEPLSRSEEGLKQWLQTNTGTKEARPKYPGILDDIFGGRR